MIRFSSRPISNKGSLLSVPYCGSDIEDSVEDTID